MRYNEDCPQCGHKFSYTVHNINREDNTVPCPKCGRANYPCGMCEGFTNCLPEDCEGKRARSVTLADNMVLHAYAAQSVA